MTRHRKARNLHNRESSLRAEARSADALPVGMIAQNAKEQRLRLNGEPDQAGTDHPVELRERESEGERETADKARRRNRGSHAIRRRDPQRRKALSRR